MFYLIGVVSQLIGLVSFFELSQLQNFNQYFKYFIAFSFITLPMIFLRPTARTFWRSALVYTASLVAIEQILAIAVYTGLLKDIALFGGRHLAIVGLLLFLSYFYYLLVGASLDYLRKRK